MLNVGIIGLGVGEKHIYGFEKNAHVMTLLIDFVSVSTSASLTAFPFFGVPEIDVFVKF